MKIDVSNNNEKYWEDVFEKMLNWLDYNSQTNKSYVDLECPQCKKVKKRKIPFKHGICSICTYKNKKKA